MSSRSDILRETLLFASGIGVVIVGLVAGGLWVSGTFTWVWFARVLVGVAVGGVILELVLVPRAFRVRTSHQNGSMPRRVDRTQSCAVALLIGAVVGGLLACGLVMDWWFELH